MSIGSLVLPMGPTLVRGLYLWDFHPFSSYVEEMQDKFRSISWKVDEIMCDMEWKSLMVMGLGTSIEGKVVREREYKYGR